MNNYKLLMILLISFLVLQNPLVSAAQSQYTGNYVTGEVDSQTQIIILDDKTFCFTFVGGQLDLLVGGNWEEDQKSQSIRLKEVKASQAIHPVLGKVINRINRKVGIEFDGYSISNANAAIFAMSDSLALPKKFKRLFSNDHSSWSSTYSLPLLTPGEVKYIFIGDRESDDRHDNSKYRITQYEIGVNDAIRIGFDMNQARPLMNMKAVLKENFLYVDGKSYGTTKEMPAKFVKQVRETCIKPAFNKSASKNNKEVGMLTPVKIFSTDEITIEDRPYFAEKNEESKLEVNSVEILLKDEHSQLNDALNLAKSDVKNIEPFFKISKILVNIKQRTKEHAPRLATGFAELLVATVGKGDLVTADKIFTNFMENIYPKIATIKNEEVQYPISVVASQALDMSIAQKRSDLEPIIFNKLLKNNFDIKKHNNRALIYKLACFYSTRSNKKAMLEAIREARKRGSPLEQFLKDGDFGKYKADAEFLKAIE